MFRFWASDSRGSDKTVETPRPIAHLIKPQQSVILSDTIATITSQSAQPPKRRRQSVDDADESLMPASPAKRAKLEVETPADMSLPCDVSSHLSPATERMERARDEILHQFSLEVLLKHDELRLINQELAKCQIALEQLRRCHLIPYPVNCPTPEQMVNISAGKGPALQSNPGELVPRWAPPFGVVDGPYARHYAKWLIPDPSFDGIQPEWQFTPEATRARASFAEGRTTRNSLSEPGVVPKGRAARGTGGTKLQALSSGYPQPKEKAGPCVLKRADGQTVKLVCIDCHRENFSSTQGFINHCRIAHKRDFKSHEEAAVACGHPIEVAEAGGITGEEKASPSIPSTNSTFVHPFARPDMTEQEAYVALRSRIADSLKLYQQGKLPGISGIPSLSESKRAKGQGHTIADLDPSPETPHLSRLLQSRNFKGNLRDIVTDAKTKVSLEDITPDEDSEDMEPSVIELNGASDAAAARTPVMRVPARSAKSPAPTARPVSSKGRTPHVDLATPPNSTRGMGIGRGSSSILSDEDLEMEDADLSPNTLISNNAPSLVSDDGEFDDSDDASSVSEASEALDPDSDTDVAEINLDDEQEPRALRRDSSGVSGSVRLRKDDSKHVTFIPVKNNTKQRRLRQA